MLKREDLERIWTELVGCHNEMFPGTSLEGLRKTNKIFSKGSSMSRPRIKLDTSGSADSLRHAIKSVGLIKEKNQF